MYGAYDFSKWKKLLRADNLVQIEVLGFLCWITANQIYLAEQTTGIPFN